MSNRHKIDEVATPRINGVRRTEISTFQVIREGFKCEKCGHHKAFYKQREYECTRCKNRQTKKFIG